MNGGKEGRKERREEERREGGRKEGGRKGSSGNDIDGRIDCVEKEKVDKG